MKLKEIIAKISAQVSEKQSALENLEISGVAPLDRAGPSEISFLADSRFREKIAKTRAAAVIVREHYENCPSLQIVHPNPYEAMALVSQLFFQYDHRFVGQSDMSFVHDGASLGEKVTVYPFAYVDAGASIGASTVLYPHVYIGVNAKIGKNCTLFPGVSIMSEVEIGDNVIIHPNTVIGGDGFGFASGDKGITKIPQVGKVVIENDVEIGSLTNIDRATFDQTKVGHSTKIDSLVHLGHNVQVGAYSFLCGQFGVAGSTKIGNKFVAGGQSGVGQGIEITDGVTIGGRCGVAQSIKEPGTYMGVPEKPAMQWHREVQAIKSLPDMVKKLRQLEKRVKELEK